MYPKIQINFGNIIPTEELSAKRLPIPRYFLIKYKFKYKIQGYIEPGIHIFPHPQTETSHLSKNLS